MNREMDHLLIPETLLLTRWRMGRISNYVIARQEYDGACNAVLQSIIIRPTLYQNGDRHISTLLEQIQYSL